MFSSYDRWKLRSPDDERNDDPKCSACEDAGCPECSGTDEPVTLEDLDEMDAQERANG